MVPADEGAMTSISVVLIPCDLSLPLQCHEVSWNNGQKERDDAAICHRQETALSDIQKLLMMRCNGNERDLQFDGGDHDVFEIPLLRPFHDSPGLYAYHLHSYSATMSTSQLANVRATRLALACGLLSMRLWGDVLISRSHPTRQPRWFSLTVEELHDACVMSPDLRRSLLSELKRQMQGKDASISEDAAASHSTGTPNWLLNAAQQNYHDAAAIARLAQVMRFDQDEHEVVDNLSQECDDTDNEDDSNSQDEKDDDQTRADDSPTHPTRSVVPTEFIAKSPLCLHCRRPTTELCPECEGAYFCPPPRDCRQQGWSHACQCHTWKLYSHHRSKLSAFEYLDSAWQAQLLGRNFQLSEEPYKEFLKSKLAVNIIGNGDSHVQWVPSKSWWRTETDGWAGGHSASAKQVNPTIRQSYEEGFAPIPTDQIPRQQRLMDQDFIRAGIEEKNAVGLWMLKSWQDYYQLREIPSTSPVALLCTYPLTIYHAIVQYGEVPVTVARMLTRPLRLHVVGVEKEMNFMDLFQEVGYLLPEDLQVELVFVVRQDMLPSHCNGDSQFLLEIEMTTNLTMRLVSGTYGVQSSSPCSLDPNFDVGSGPPDMVIGLNAGLYAYESWRSVVDYLYHNTGVVGIFTDYNEYSGMNCASLGGAASRESLTVNPFRQPLALPVYSMNLPQFSNGFMYVFNALELE
jgi:hypothetical protein